MHAQTASPAAFCAYLTRNSSAFARQTQICNSKTDESPAKQRVLVVKPRQLQKRSGNSLLCSASGGLLGGLKRAFGGKKEKLPRKSENVEFPPCRYLQLICHIFASHMFSLPPLTLYLDFLKLLKAVSHTINAGFACRILKSTKDYELRIYDVYPFVTTPYQRRDEGYLALGSYMEGRNADSAKMNLTQPIMMRYEPATVSTSNL